MKLPLLLFLGAGLLLSRATAWAGACCASNATPACCAARGTASTNYTDRSLYQLESRWTTDTGRRIQLSDLKGRPQLVVMFFANCQYACPLLVHDMQRIAEALPAAARGQVGFTLVSFDPKRDTPAALAGFRATRQLPPENWTLLRGVADDILELAALLGVKYKEDAGGQFAHSNVITLLNADGEIVRQQVGLGQDPKEMAQAVAKLLPD